MTDFPQLVTAPDAKVDVSAWISEHREALLTDVERVGAVLMRGFPLHTDLDFDGAIASFGLPGFTYQQSLSNAVRKERTERVFTANEAPPDVEIFLHHEMAQTPIFPSKLFFFCELAPTVGGATPLCRSDLLLEQLQQQLPEFVAKCREHGVRYTNVMPGEADAMSGQGRSWKSTLDCSDQATAEARLASLGYSWQWQDDGSLRATTPALPAIRSLPSGTEVFFNQLIAAYMGWKDARNATSKVVRFGDDSAISDADMGQVAALAEALTFDLQWQAGDMVIVDNFLVMHGRRPFQGRRGVLAALVA
ncbi:MAG: TauD/TfdA family dioxygenase [Gammaproteobacteria bacterium]